MSWTTRTKDGFLRHHLQVARLHFTRRLFSLWRSIGSKQNANANRRLTRPLSNWPNGGPLSPGNQLEMGGEPYVSGLGQIGLEQHSNRRLLTQLTDVV